MQFKKPKVKLDKKILKQNLSKYLPSNFKDLIDNLAK